jgi:hypothetical protein
MVVHFLQRTQRGVRSYQGITCRNTVAGQTIRVGRKRWLRCNPAKKATSCTVCNTLATPRISEHCRQRAESRQKTPNRPPGVHEVRSPFASGQCTHATEQVSALSRPLPGTRCQIPQGNFRRSAPPSLARAIMCRIRQIRGAPAVPLGLAPTRLYKPGPNIWPNPIALGWTRYAHLGGVD